MIQAGDIPDLVQNPGRCVHWMPGPRRGSSLPSRKPRCDFRALPEAKGKLIGTPGVRPTVASSWRSREESGGRDAGPSDPRDGADHIVVGRPIWPSPKTPPSRRPARVLAELPLITPKMASNPFNSVLGLCVYDK